MENTARAAAQAAGWSAFVVGILGNFTAAFLGRLLYHHRLVQAGKRRFWSMNLFWEVPMAVFTGLVGHSAATYLGLTGLASSGLVAMVAYLGPHGMEHLLITLAVRREPAKCPPPPDDPGVPGKGE